MKTWRRCWLISNQKGEGGRKAPFQFMPAPKVLIDINSLGFAAQQGSKTRLHAGEIETTAVFGVLRSLKLIREQFHGQPMALWDGRSWRYDTYEGYKGNRESNPKQVEQRDAWRAQRLLVGRLFKTLGVHQVIASNMEADDLAASMRRLYANKGHEVVLVSGDKDWLQLLQPGIVAWDHVRERLVTSVNFTTHTGLPTPYSMAEFKSLQGDSSDCIPGVGGIGEKTAKAILGDFNTVTGFVNAMMADPKLRAETDKRALLLMDADRQDKFKANMRLIWLDHPDVPKPQGLKVIQGQFDADAFREFCEEHAFHSVLRDFPNWTSTFSREDK